MTTATRQHLSSKLRIGQEWERRSRASDRQTVRVRMPHRSERTVEVEDVRSGGRFLLSFNELRHRWRLVEEQPQGP